MLILAVVSEPAFDLMDIGLDFAHYLDSQSNMITLLFGYLGLLATEALVPSAQAEGKHGSVMRTAALFCAYGLLGFANYMAHGSFNIAGPWLIIAFYWFIRVSGNAEREGRPWTWGKRLLVIVSGFTVYLVLYFWVRSGFGDAARWWEEVVKYAPWIAGHMIAAFILSFYSGTLGYPRKWFSRMYTCFYPAHMYVIGIIGILVGRT